MIKMQTGNTIIKRCSPGAIAEIQKFGLGLWALNTNTEKNDIIPIPCQKNSQICKDEWRENQFICIKYNPYELEFCT